MHNREALLSSTTFAVCLRIDVDIVIVQQSSPEAAFDLHSTKNLNFQT